jgi:hypothetical protein
MSYLLWNVLFRKYQHHFEFAELLNILVRRFLFLSATFCRILLHSTVQLTVVGAMCTRWCWFFWLVMLCRPVDRYQHYCFCFQPSRWGSMFIWMSVFVSISTQCFNPEDQLCYLHLLENLKSHILYTFLPSVESPKESLMKNLLLQVVNGVSDVKRMTVMNQNCIPQGIKSELHLRNSCCHTPQTFLFFFPSCYIRQLPRK